MLFNSPEYLLLFLPVAVLIFHLLSRASDTQRQITWLVMASLVFYASWKPIYLLLIIASVVVNFALSRKLSQNSASARRYWLIVGICFNLGLLAYFKYTGFFVNSLNELGNWLIPVPEITLPLAISFFTFQQIAYLVDVSTQKCQEYQFRHYALFVLFFPQLIAGPIVHHAEMMPQFRRLRPPGEKPTDFAVGITFIAIGLFKKVVLADSLALVADPVFDAAHVGTPLNTIDALLAMFAFSFQIYFDFSGYTDIAIGSARLFGIKLPENFRSPYKSRSVIEIWGRWHMTLSRFLRDYLYIPLGGNRHGSLRRYRNLVLTMVLGGLWHGAAWTFVAWGALHGFYLCINHGWRALASHFGIKGLFERSVFQLVFVGITFFAWAVSFVIFRSADMPTAWNIISAAVLDFSIAEPYILGNAFSSSFWGRLPFLPEIIGSEYGQIYGLMLIASAIIWLLPNSQQLMAKFKPVVGADEVQLGRGIVQWRPTYAVAAIIGLMLSVAILSLSSISSFIYFQF